jgi:hypothetical protein
MKFGYARDDADGQNLTEQFGGAGDRPGGGESRGGHKARAAVKIVRSETWAPGQSQSHA